MKDYKIRSGYRVIGNNTSDGALHSWFFNTLEEANSFADQLCKSTGKEVDVCKYLGSWKLAPQTEFIKSND